MDGERDRGTQGWMEEPSCRGAHGDGGSDWFREVGLVEANIS